MADWTADLEPTVKGVIKDKTYDSLSAKFPNITYTTVETTTTTAKFPNVYIHVLESPEAGGSTEGDSIEAVYLTVQVDVTTNGTKDDAKEIIYAVLDVLKQMRFSATAMPIFSKEDDIQRAVMRARRRIGSGDALI